ncbi:MAG: glycosyltransferase family 2 protein [Actinobacteria bacterium]|nr:glycosyltransferase family 2 protein [Actinomycetota bacterium]
MKLVMTLLARDEADVIEAWLAFHLNAGADFVVATDNRSEDGTTDVLETYAREGHLHLLREAGEDLRQNEWVTRMARLAATDFGADWVINSDADEFWWPRGASLRDVLDAVPERYGTVGAFLRTFGPRPDGGEGSFAERMTVRFSALAPINDPASLFKPIRKVVHRAHPEIQVTRGNHALVDSPFAPLRGWYPIEVFHFPLRSHAQCERKATLQGTAFEKYVARPPTAYHANMFAALKSGQIAEYYDALVLAEGELERGLEQGRLVEDTRLRDALRSLRANGGFKLPSEARPLDFPIPSLVEDAEYAVEAAVLGEADVVRLQRRLDTLERRLLTLELRLPARVYRKLSGTAKRALRRGEPA